MNVVDNNPLDRVEKATDIITLRQLLSGQHVFRVPDYQRGYAWSNEFHVLWKDIMRLHITDTSARMTLFIGSRRRYIGIRLTAIK